MERKKILELSVSKNLGVWVSAILNNALFVRYTVNI